MNRGFCLIHCQLISRVIIFHSVMLAFDNMRTSSTNSTWRILVSLDTLIPEICPSSKLCFSNRLSPSIAKMKRSRDNRHPCLSPLPLLKNYEASPLISTAKEEDVMQDIIHFILWGLKPTLWRISLRKSQSRKSYDFLRSNFSTKDFILCFFYTVKALMGCAYGILDTPSLEESHLFSRNVSWKNIF